MGVSKSIDALVVIGIVFCIAMVLWIWLGPDD